MSSVLTMDAEGISKFWKMKVITKRPMARTVQMEARDSRGVSACSCSANSGLVASVVMVSGKTLLHRCSYQCIADGRGRRGGFTRGGDGDLFADFFSCGGDGRVCCFCR